MKTVFWRKNYCAATFTIVFYQNILADIIRGCELEGTIQLEGIQFVFEIVKKLFFFCKDSKIKSGEVESK